MKISFLVEAFNNPHYLVAIYLSIQDEIRPTLVEKTSVAVSPGTVKEKVQMLKMTSEGNLTAPAPQPHQMLLRSAQMQKDAGSGASGSRRALSSRNVSLMWPTMSRKD